MPELPREYKKFDLSYLDNVVDFSEGWDFPIDHMDGILELNTHLAVRPAEFELSHGPSKNRTFPSSKKVLSRGRRSCDECSEEVGEKGFLESGSPTFRIDSSGKDLRRTGFEGPDWRQEA
ncbi:uncharacterized protein TNCV_4368001 [Trichonephila clavipes]|nr:uncharacterized protein TNCV_4368001 [Trichonephila clavipes]